MNIIICETYEKMSEAAATIIAAQVMTKQDSILGLATGSTPLGTYSGLIQLHRGGSLDFKNVRTFNLDEYVGIEKTNSRSYFYFMNENLFSKINIAAANTKIPNGLADDLECECKEYEKLIEMAGGIDLQLLGIGHNGHIGFNEPDAYFPQNTHIVKLAETTIEANSRFFSDARDVPTSAITMGIGTIMKARKVILLASGKDKADIVRELICGDVKPQVPASILRFHNDVTIITDAAAGAKIA
ncbi:MAG: glucosamine-6-phosphate deaminase [Oscillospiraceae bacterium]|nr:glucosamine-6-phosphate deaminase [Oscillospiraceae bacterium]